MRKSTDSNQCLSIRKQLLCILDVQDQTGKVLYGETPHEIREAQPSLTRKFFRLNCQPYVVMESNSHHYSGFTQVKAQTLPRPGKGLAHAHPGCVTTGDEMPTVPPGPRGTDKTGA